jgi:hypothetical protein
MTRLSEDFEEKHPDESNTEARPAPPSEDFKDYTFVAHGVLALLGAVIIFYALSVAEIAVFLLSLPFSSWLETGVFSSELPTGDLIAIFFGSCFLLCVGYLLARCWPFVGCIGLAALLSLSGLGILPGGMNWDESFLLQSIPGVALFIFAFYKRDALRYVAKKKPEGSVHNACSCAACRQADAPRPLPSALAATAAKEKGDRKSVV